MRTSSPLGLQKENKKYTKVERKPKNPNFGPLLDAGRSVRCTAGDIYRAEGSRVPSKHLHEIWSMDKIKVPRFRGFCRGSAALWWLLATRFGAWPLLVRPCGLLLLEF